MALRDKLKEREGDPISIGPTVELIQRLARITGVKPWLIRWGGERKYSRLRYGIFLVGMERGSTSTSIADVFEIDHSSVVQGRNKARERVASDPDYAALVEKLRKDARDMDNIPAIADAMSSEQRAVLREQGEDYGHFMPTLSERLDMELKDVRLACRENERQGLLLYTTVWNEDEGRPHGSAYLRTPLGTRVLQHIGGEGDAPQSD